MDNNDDNVIYLSAHRPAPTFAVIADDRAVAGKDTVFFVTGGRYECMVNNTVGVVGRGEFVRVPADAVYSLGEMGPGACSLVSYKFASGAPSGLLRDIAGALSPFAPSFPRPGSCAFARLESIASRWGYRLDSDAAA